ncbi:MAG TPA: SCP2 sterol-binding domain-containing protein [Longimicrobium sp.]|nr:SCP2 sterol-binding domain-containing protein [Longimicrobium sp.]
MAGRQPIPWAERARQFEDDPVLSEFARPFPDLLGDDDDIGGSFEQIARALGKSKRTGSIQVSVGEGRKTRRYGLAMTPGACEVTGEAIESPDLEIITDAKTWADIASGRVAPLEAFGSGKVRVLGSIEMARVLARRVHR